jgi:hypothetical protein
MKRMSAALMALAACQSTSDGGGPGAEDIMVATMVSTDPMSILEGQWVIYGVLVQGEAQSQTTKIQVTKADPDGVWIEQKIQPPNMTPWVIKSKFDRKGALLERWAGEAGSPAPAKVYPRADGREPPAGPAPTSVKVESTRETITVRGQSWDCTKLISTITYSGGKTTVLTDWCHPAVPFPVLKDGQPVGGVVKREYGRYRVELFAHGMGAREELRIPK